MSILPGSALALLRQGSPGTDRRSATDLIVPVTRQ
jgi:hypothetical protein